MKTQARLKRWLHQDRNKRTESGQNGTIKLGGSRIAYFKQYWLKPKWYSFKDRLKFMSKVPFVVVVAFMMLFWLIVSLINTSILSERWKNDVISAYPKLTEAVQDAEGNLQLSPLDFLFTHITAKHQAFWIIALAIQINIMLGDIWLSFNPRKPQSWNLRGE